MIVIATEATPDTEPCPSTGTPRLAAERDADQRQELFKRRYAGWLAEQNAQLDAQGSWNVDLRVW